MLFYASLFLFCIAVSVIALWFYRFLYDIGKAAYRAILPRARKAYKEEKVVSLSSDLAASVTPWGWSSDQGSRRAIPVASPVVKQAAPTPWGWKGNNSRSRSRTSRVWVDVGEAAESLKDILGSPGKENTEHVGWPYREEKFAFAGKEHAVVRKKRIRRTNAGGKSKPWGW